MIKKAIIIPCYNEEKRLPADEFRVYTATHEDVDLFFVNDGSSDRTMEILKNLSSFNPGQMKVLDIQCNSGKSEAVRAGIIHALSLRQYGILGFWDADLATPLQEIELLIAYLAGKDEFAYAFGSRIKTLGVVIERKVLRHYFGRVFATFASGIVRLPVYDTQCGAKIFKKEVAEIVFNEPFSSRWLFDIEIFARMIEIFGHGEAQKMMVEVPLRKWTDKGKSKISFTYLLKMPFEMWTIYRRHRRKMRKAG